MLKKYGLFVFLSVSSLQLNAGLEWDSRAVQIDLKPEDSEAAATFTFKNTGDGPVMITEAKASCSCVVLNEVKGTYKKGEGGTIKALYSVGTTIGTMVEHIEVKTAESEKPETLRLTVNIPVLYKLHPTFVSWSVGEQSQAKDIIFLDLTGNGIKPVQVYSADEDLSATLIKDEASNRYTIRLQPKSTAQPRGSAVYVDVDLGNGKIRKVKVIASVIDPAAPKGGHMRVKS